MWYWIKEKIKDFIDNHLVSQFPDDEPAFCLNCNQGNCKGCIPYDEFKKDPDKGWEAWYKKN
jgi:hypothetical protein